ncbi:MAG: sulfotransferase [Leptolyngbya foveolarum]|uniref:Sulfotransferase n=1 Tax=Leptolyngbya foveolarum TaxID=47253 RepID=A0A2W4UDJ2_9CYAN|nr:MAG: sulfotransferase [Leptolyngbya foveolarum]
MVAQLDSLYIRTSLSKTLTRLLSYVCFEGRPLTTKGQWINSLVFPFLALQKRLPQMKQVYKPIFIVGTGRSGTTVLGTILSMHRHVGFLNEPKALWHAIYPSEDLVGSYSRGVAKYRLDGTDASPKVRRAAHRLFGAYLALSSSRRVVDKYPELVFRVPFVRALFPDAKFIFLVRNGWDTCQSIDGWSQRMGVEVEAETHDWWGVDNRKWNLLWDQVIHRNKAIRGPSLEQHSLENPLDMAALEWIVSMREGLAMMEQLPNDTYMMHYEDLVASPRKSLAKLAAFCELPPDERFLDYATQRLKPAPPKHDIEIHPAIRPYFEETMVALGYDSTRAACAIR